MFKVKFKLKTILCLLEKNSTCNFPFRIKLNTFPRVGLALVRSACKKRDNLTRYALGPRVNSTVGQNLGPEVPQFIGNLTLSQIWSLSESEKKADKRETLSLHQVTKQFSKWKRKSSPNCQKQKLIIGKNGKLNLFRDCYVETSICNLTLREYIVIVEHKTGRTNQHALSKTNHEKNKTWSRKFTNDSAIAMITKIVIFIIICHGFLLSSRRGNHVTSGYTP